MALDIVLNGSLPHDFIVTFDPDLRSAIYYGQEGSISGISKSSGIKNRDIQSRVKSQALLVLGGGSAKYEGDLENSGVLVVGGYSTDYGAVPKSILDLLQEELIKRYQNIFPSVKTLKLEPDESKVVSSGYFDLEEITKLFQT